MGTRCYFLDLYLLEHLSTQALLLFLAEACVLTVPCILKAAATVERHPEPQPRLCESRLVLPIDTPRMREKMKRMEPEDGVI